MELFSHPSFNVIQNLWHQWRSWDSGRQRFLRVQCCDLSVSYGWYCITGSWSSAFQKLGNIVSSSCGLLPRLLPQDGCWQTLAGIQEAKQNTTPAALACVHWEAAAMASGGFGFFQINFVCPPSFHPYLKNRNLIAQQQMHINIKQNFHYRFRINMPCQNVKWAGSAHGTTLALKGFRLEQSPKFLEEIQHFPIKY